MPSGRSYKKVISTPFTVVYDLFGIAEFLTETSRSNAVCKRTWSRTCSRQRFLLPQRKADEPAELYSLNRPFQISLHPYWWNSDHSLAARIASKRLVDARTIRTHVIAPKACLIRAAGERTNDLISTITRRDSVNARAGDYTPLSGPAVTTGD